MHAPRCGGRSTMRPTRAALGRAPGHVLAAPTSQDAWPGAGRLCVVGWQGAADPWQRPTVALVGDGQIVKGPALSVGGLAQQVQEASRVDPPALLPPVAQPGLRSACGWWVPALVTLGAQGSSCRPWLA